MSRSAWVAATRTLPSTYQAARSGRFRDIAKPLSHRGHQVRVEVTPLARSRSKVPAMYEVISGQLRDVFGNVFLAIGEMDQTACRQSFGDCRQRLVGRRDC